MATTKKKSKAVKKTDKKKAEVAEVNLLEEMRADAGAGQEGIGRDDVALPFIRVLQALSDEISKRSENHIEGAEPGMFFNTVTRELFDGEKGIRVIPCSHQKSYVEWIPRDAGGGFVAEYPSKDEAIAGSDPENEITDTANHYLLIETEKGWQEALFPMTSTKLRTSRRWNALVRMKKIEGEDGESFSAPAFSYVYRLKTVETENDKGRFFSLQVEEEERIEEPKLFHQAKRFWQLIRQGAVQVDFSKYEGTDSDDEDDDNPDF